MGLNNYLLELISTEELVCLPDFGGFISKHVSAHLDPSTHIFTPPHKQLAFNERLTEDGGRLVRFVQKKEQLPQEEAEAKVVEFVAEIRKSLGGRKEFYIKGVGIFYALENGNVGFKSLLDSESDPLNFGLPQILVKYQPTDSSKKDFLQKPKNRNAMSTHDLESVPDAGQDGDNPSSEHHHEKSAKKSNPLIWLYIVTPIVLLAGLGTFLGVTDDGRKVLASMHIIKSAPLESDSLLDEGTTEAEAATEESTTETASTESFDNATSAEETIKKTETEKWGEEPVKSKQEDIAKTEDARLAIANLIRGRSGRCFVIVGGFSTKRNAVKLREKLIQDGLESKIIAPTEAGALYRVSLGDYPDKASALQKAQELRPNYGDGIWVMVY